MIKAIIFDFDGTILDSESTCVQGWEEVYAPFGVTFPLHLWALNIGTEDLFDPITYLAEQTGQQLDGVAIHTEATRRHHALLAIRPPLPGVQERIAEAQALGLKLGIASSSSNSWVNYYLPRLGLQDDFAVVCGRDDVGGKRKPDPAVYLAACAGLGVAPGEALALEDSQNGVLAAKGAGLFCTAVPNAQTRHMDFSGADMVVESLTAVSLAQIITTLTP
jgi:HAD superfamily hydrolase (TIGR01509 family)